jgi:hypothetical protein
MWEVPEKLGLDKKLGSQERLDATAAKNLLFFRK